MIDKSEFLQILGGQIQNLNLGETENNYIKDKGDKIVDMLIELENRDLLKTFNQIEATTIREQIIKTSLTFEDIKKLYLECNRLVDNNQTQQSEIKLKDDSGNEYVITGNQIIIMFGWTYCSLCETIYRNLISIIDFPRLSPRLYGGRIKNPTGIGALIWALKENGDVNNLSFFEDIDTKVRNSFFHLKFRIEDDRVYCEHNPSVYANYHWRTQADNNQSEYILLEDLIKLVLNGDRSSYTVMHGCEYFIGKSGF